MGQRLIISEEERHRINKMYGLINEQNEYEIPDVQKETVDEKIKEGYVDITDSFKSGKHVLQIADGSNYKSDGWGIEFKILTNDNKETGYYVVLKSGYRGKIPTETITVSEDGKKIDFGGLNEKAKEAKLLYNEKLNEVKDNK